jgi:hypothetical protein
MAGINTVKSGLRTICEVHREMYRKIHHLYHTGVIDEETWHYLITRTEEGFNLGKKMNNKLAQYKNNYADDWYEEHRLDGGELEEATKIQQEINKRGKSNK